MARARNRVCSTPGCPNMQPETLCATHRRDRERYQRSTVPTKATRTRAEQARRKAAVDAHRARYGDWCLGDSTHQPHASDDLTADHIVAVANGGAPDGALQVMCRRANSSKAARR